MSLTPAAWGTGTPLSCGAPIAALWPLTYVATVAGIGLTGILLGIASKPRLFVRREVRP